MNKTWGSELNSNEKRKAHNMWATAIYTYYYGAIYRTRTDPVRLDRKTKKILRKHGCHHHNVPIE